MGPKREGSILTEKEMLMDIKPITTRGIIVDTYSKDFGTFILLLEKHPYKGNEKDVTYTFPGGHCEEGETAFSTLVRECVEEAGIEVTPERECFRHYKIDKKQPERGNGIMGWYFAIPTNFTPKGPYIEHDKVVHPKWVSLSEFEKIPKNKIKPDFIKPYILEAIDGYNFESKFLEEVYTC